MGTLPTYLAIDLGTSAVKAACIDQNGVSIGSATVEYPLRTLPAGRVECEADLAEAASTMTRVAGVVDPNPSLAGVYADAYARYRSLSRYLRPFGTPDGPEASRASA